MLRQTDGQWHWVNLEGARLASQREQRLALVTFLRLKNSPFSLLTRRLVPEKKTAGEET